VVSIFCKLYVILAYLPLQYCVFNASGIVQSFLFCVEYFYHIRCLRCWTDGIMYYILFSVFFSHHVSMFCTVCKPVSKSFLIVFQIFHFTCLALQWTHHLNGRRFLYIEVHRDCTSWLQCSTIWRLKAISSEGLYVTIASENCNCNLTLDITVIYASCCIWLFLVKIGVTLWKRYIPMAHQSVL